MPNTAFSSASIVAVPHAKGMSALSGKVEPYVICVFETAFGNVACVAAPIKDCDLFKDQSKTVAAILAATEFAIDKGATTISYTGMLPASTQGLLSVHEAIQQSELYKTHPKLRITTGHETVVAAFAMNIHQICSISGREFNNENVTFIGLGHVGEATLELLFRLGYRPKSINLVDIEAKQKKLEALHSRLTERYGYEGDLEIITVDKYASVLPKKLYTKTSFIVSASSSGNIIDIDQLRPGTLIVDDSFPLIFDADKARRRIEMRRDILITVAGALASDNGVRCLEHNTSENPVISQAFVRAVGAISVDAKSLTGCVYSSVLTGHFEVPTGLGKVNPDYAFAQYKCYERNGFRGTRLYVFDLRLESKGAYFIPSEVIAYFKKHYSENAMRLSSGSAINIGLFKNADAFGKVKNNPVTIRSKL